MGPDPNKSSDTVPSDWKRTVSDTATSGILRGGYPQLNRSERRRIQSEIRRLQKAANHG